MGGPAGDEVEATGRISLDLKQDESSSKKQQEGTLDKYITKVS